MKEMKPWPWKQQASPGSQFYGFPSGHNPIPSLPLPFFSVSEYIHLTAFIHGPQAHSHLDFTHGCIFLFRTLPRQEKETAVDKSRGL